MYKRQILNRLRNRLDDMGVDEGLSEEEMERLRLVWAYKSVKDADAILKHYGMEMPFEI